MSSIVTTAVILKAFRTETTVDRKCEVVDNFECPSLGEEDALIKIEACALNDTDIKIVDALKIVVDGQISLGHEISGTIRQVGNAVSKFKIDDEVAGIIPLDGRCGGFAKLCVVSQHDIVLKPANVKHVDAAAVLKDALKACTALHYLAKVSSGDTILICNGASGFGLAATQLAKNINVKVIATVNTEEEFLFLKGLQLPPDQIIRLRSNKCSVVNTCFEETGGLGIDCVIDDGVELYSHSVELYSHSAADDLINFDDDLRVKLHKHDVISSLAVGGRWITSQSDLQLDPPDSQLLFLKCASLHFLFEDSWTLSKGAQGKYLHILEDIMNKLSQRILRPTIHHCIQLDDCPRALESLQEIKVGKVVVKLT